MLEILKSPWPWYVSGALIAIVMLTMFFFGQRFGVSSNFKTVCAMCGAGKVSKFFDFDWKENTWNLLFLFGSVLGGYISSKWLSDGKGVKISEETIQDLNELGLGAPTSMQPSEIFSWSFLTTFEGFVILVIGGFLIGFGTRYASGCTSGHAITGLSTFQLPSLVAVIGFFIGGLFTTFVLLPALLG
jgi:uncharacterized membrane protein YedE/YeeE